VKAVAYEVKNSEILFIYGAKLCNPNGDPDNENKPRMDIKTSTNLVSDVRLKRYLRDYVVERFGEKYIWVTKLEGRHVRPVERFTDLKERYKGGVEPELVCNSCLDARLFGATIPLPAEEKAKGKSEAFTGPVQFTWGFSLHPVEMVESSGITSMFVGREAKGEEKAYGTMGKDWRLYYSLIAFYGVVSGLRAKRNGLRDVDVKALDNFLWNALKSGATTRSKIGQTPHLYLRVEYNDDETITGDLRKFLGRKTERTIRDVKDVTLNYSSLIGTLEEWNERINAIYLRETGEIVTSNGKRLEQRLREHDKLKDKVVMLPHPKPQPKTPKEFEEMFVIG